MSKMIIVLCQTDNRNQESFRIVSIPRLLVEPQKDVFLQLLEKAKLTNKAFERPK